VGFTYDGKGKHPAALQSLGIFLTFDGDTVFQRRDLVGRINAAVVSAGLWWRCHSYQTSGPLSFL
jgi:hypothetical protein